MREVREERKERQLEELNRERERLLLPLIHLRDGLRRAVNTGEMLLRLNDFLEEIQLNETLNATAAELSEAGELQKAQEYAQVYAIICGLMEQMYGILGNTVRSVEEFRLLFRTAVSLYTMGTIPASMDCISVGSLSSQRRSDTPYLFLLGANEGAFPSVQSNQSLLTDSERTLLMSHGIGVAPTTMQSLDRELAMMDSVFSAPEKGLYIGTVKGREAYYARRARKMFPDANCVESDEGFLCRAAREYFVVADQPQPYEIPCLSDEAVTALYGKTLRLSSSKVDLLASCRFAYFLQYGLKAEERKAAQMDASLYGTFVHDVLEHTVPKVMEEGGFAAVPVERVLEIAEEFMEAYTVNVLAPLWESERAEYLFRRSFSEVRTVVRRLYAELSVSEFEPKWFELSFGGYKGDLPAVKIVGERVEAALEGKVDRADVWQDGERCFVRVVDYKTGKKSFEYTKIYYGLGLQMLLYLFAIKRMGEQLLPQKPYPAGVLYFPARREQVSKQERLSPQELEQHAVDSHRCSGLLYRDERVLQAMEPGEAPRFMPYRNDKRGVAQNYLADGEQLRALEEFVFSKVAELGDELYSGRIRPNPYEGTGELGSACQWCPYGNVCAEQREVRRLERMSPNAFWEAVEGGCAHG
jgi:ATP-dependent helicase/nuclease subunit B